MFGTNTCRASHHAGERGRAYCALLPSTRSTYSTAGAATKLSGRCLLERAVRAARSADVVQRGTSCSPRTRSPAGHVGGDLVAASRRLAIHRLGGIGQGGYAGRSPGPAGRAGCGCGIRRLRRLADAPASSWRASAPRVRGTIRPASPARKTRSRCAAARASRQS